MSIITTEKEFVNPLTEKEWTSEGVAQENSVQTIIYVDEKRGTYCRILKFPDAFGELSHTEACCSHNFDECVFIATGGAINKRLDYRYKLGSISSFPAGINHGPLWTPFGALLVEFRHYRDEHLKGIKGDGQTQEKEFLDPATEMEWTTEGIQLKGTSHSIRYKDKDLGTNVRAVRYPEGFRDNAGSTEADCFVNNDFDEVVYIYSGGLINRRLGHRYQPGTIGVFKKGVKYGPFEAPFGAQLISFCHYSK